MSFLTEELWSPYADTQSSSGTVPDSVFLHHDDLAAYDAHNATRTPIGFAPPRPQETPMATNVKSFVREGRTLDAFDVPGANDSLIEVDVLGPHDDRVVCIEAFDTDGDLGIASFTPAQARDLAAVILAAADTAAGK